MRSSIIILFLFINFGLHAFQPKDTAKKELKLKVQELAQEMQRPTSYLSLLPRDLKQKINKTIYPTSVEDEITAIRKKYLTYSEPEQMLKFLHDEAFNQEIIDNLMQNFNIPSHQIASVTIMLNTPASFKIAFKKIRNIFTNYFRSFYHAFQEYITSASLNCEDLLNYTDFFVINMKDLNDTAKKSLAEMNLEPVILNNSLNLIERYTQEVLDDIKWILQQKLNFESNKEGGWRCAIQ